MTYYFQQDLQLLPRCSNELIATTSIDGLMVVRIARENKTLLHNTYYFYTGSIDKIMKLTRKTRLTIINLQRLQFQVASRINIQRVGDEKLLDNNGLIFM